MTAVTSALLAVLGTFVATPVAASTPSHEQTTSYSANPFVKDMSNASRNRTSEPNLTKEQRQEIKLNKKHYEEVLGYEPEVYFLHGDPYPTVEIQTVPVDQPTASELTEANIDEGDMVMTPMDSTFTPREVTCSGHNNYRLVQKTTGRNYCFTNPGAKYAAVIDISNSPKENIIAQCPGIYETRYRYTWYSYGTEGQVYPHHTFSQWRSSSSTSTCYYNPDNIGHRVTAVYINLK